jgi:eukaryotic-like serine/threonine-protein kinase
MMTGQTLGPYRILAKLGEGGMGVVYRAHDPRLDRDVALKLLPAEYAADPGRRARFDREARAAAALNHPNICTIHEVGEADGQVYIAMELLEGATLSECLATGPAPIATGEVLDIGIQIADALNAAREKHIVHRDLKSGNIVLLPRGQVKVLDFGLAKRAREVAPDAPTDLAGAAETRAAATGLTEVGAVMGTVAYMSPEQALGEHIDHRSDLFSFGVVLYELLTGRLPFAGRTHTATIDAVLHQEPAPIPRFNEQVPDALVAVVKTLLEKDRERRYQSAADVLAELRRIKDDLAAGRAPTSSAQTAVRAPTSAWSRWPVRLALAGVLLALVALGAWRWWPSRTRQIDPTRAASLVALPARVQGPPDAQYLTEGIPNALSSHLLGVKGLQAKVPPTSAEFEQMKGNVQALARAYGAELCLISSVTVLGDQLVLVLQLEDPATRNLVWSRTYEGKQASYLALLRDAADGVRSALRPASSPVQAPPSQTTSSAAMQALQRGQYFSNRYNSRHEPADSDAAIRFFEEALTLDPGLAQAAAEASFILSLKQEAGASPKDFLPEMARWAAKAVALDPRNGDGWSMRASAEALRPAPALSLMREWALRGATLAPRSAKAQNELAASARLPLHLVVAATLEAHRVDPVVEIGFVNLALILYYQGRSSEALPYLDEADRLYGGSVLTPIVRAIVLADLHQASPAAEAARQVRASVSVGRADESFLLMTEPAVQLEIGDRRAADASLGRVHAYASDPATAPYVLENIILFLVPALSRHGRIDDALRLLTTSAGRGVLPPYDWLALDPRLAPLRPDRRFAAVLGQARTAFEIALQDIDAARSRGEFPAYLEPPLKEMRAKLGM